MGTIILHTLAISALYVAGRWHEKHLMRKAAIQRRLDIIAQETRQ